MPPPPVQAVQWAPGLWLRHDHMHMHLPCPCADPPPSSPSASIHSALAPATPLTQAIALLSPWSHPPTYPHTLTSPQAVISRVSRRTITYASRVYPAGVNFTLVAGDAAPGRGDGGGSLGLSVQVGGGEWGQWGAAQGRCAEHACLPCYFAM